MPTSLRPQEPLLPCPKNSGAVLRSGCRGEQELEHSSAWLTPGFHGWKQRLGACCFYKLPAPHTVPWALPVLPISLWKTSSVARKGSSPSPSPSSSSSGQPWWLGDRRDLPEGAELGSARGGSAGACSFIPMAAGAGWVWGCFVQPRSFTSHGEFLGEWPGRFHLPRVREAVLVAPFVLAELCL